MTLVERLRAGITHHCNLKWDVTPLHLEAADEIERLEKALETAREALEGSVALIDHLLHVHVAPDECTSYVEQSRNWFSDNGGTLACMADQQATNRRTLSQKKEG